jgi:enterochelin esterase-like enzyme
MLNVAMRAYRFAFGFVVVLMLAAGVLLPQGTGDAPPLKGTVERIKVHGKSLEGNLAGDAADRDVSIYLPPSYKTERNRRYPVVYMLHGFTDDDARWFGVRQHWINLPTVLEKALAGGSREMIVVMPNAFTAFQGSMYSSSATTGDWESYVARELVAWIDGHYRTLARRESRGLAGHSMGGYGTMRIGMKNPDVFSAIYLLSPCCMAPRVGAMPQGSTGPSRAEAVKTFADIEKADFGTKAQLASAAAWAPNPKKPPLYLDLPTKDGEIQPAIVAKLAANAPLAMVDQYIPNLRRLKAIAFDAGDQDRAIAASIQVLDQVLNSYEIPHTFEIYEGNHVNRVAERIETKTMPFFSSHLSHAARR